MRLEIPKFTRCCGCLPLRRGIIALGYMSLGLTLYFMALLFWFDPFPGPTGALYRGAGFFAEKWLPVLLYSIEVVFIIILLVGAHMERHILMRIYYLYGITTTAAALATYLFVSLPMKQSHWSFYVTDLSLIFTGIATQLYLLLLIRSALQKPTEADRNFNHLADVYARPAHNGLSLL